MSILCWQVESFFDGVVDVLILLCCSLGNPTSFPGSFISPPQRERGKQDPGSGW